MAYSTAVYTHQNLCQSYLLSLRPLKYAAWHDKCKNNDNDSNNDEKAIPDHIFPFRALWAVVVPKLHKSQTSTSLLGCSALAP